MSSRSFVVAIAACVYLGCSSASSPIVDVTPSTEIELQKSPVISPEEQPTSTPSSAFTKVQENPPASQEIASTTISPAVPSITKKLRLKNAINGEYPFTAVHLPGPLKHLKEIPIVVFFHGWYGCLDVLLSSDAAPCRPEGKTRTAMDLERQFDAAGVDALLLVPQLAFDEASSAPGKLTQPKRFKAMVNEVLQHPDLAEYLPKEHKIGHLILIAHSGGYLALGQALARGGLDVHEVWMMDAHYVDVPALSPWFRAHRKAFSAEGGNRMAFLYTKVEKTGTRSLRLLKSLTQGISSETLQKLLWVGEVAEVAPEEALHHPLVAQQTEIPHGKIPRVFMAPMLKTARLPSHEDHQGH